MPKLVTACRFAAWSLTVAVAFTGCGGSTQQSGNIEPESIFQRYAVHYEKATNVTGVQADFFNGSPAGVALELSGGSKVTDNGTELVRPQDFAPFYTAKLPGLVLKNEFVLVHRDGVEEKNTIEMGVIAPAPPPVPQVDPKLLALETLLNTPFRAALQALGAVETVPANAKTYTFNWEGAPVGESESVYLIVENATGRIERPATLPGTGRTAPPTGTGGRDLPQPLPNPPKATDEVTRTAKYFDVSTPGAIGLTLSTKDLDTIGEGRRTIKFQRVTRKRIEVPDGAGGTRLRVLLTASYMSETRPVAFEKRPQPTP